MSEESLISCFCNLGCDIPDEAVVGRCKCLIQSIIYNIIIERVRFLMCSILSTAASIESCDK